MNQEMKPWLINKIMGFIPKVGDRIHLHKLQGHYEIVEILPNGVKITCKVWQARNNYPNKLVTKDILFEDIKCKYVGI